MREEAIALGQVVSKDAVSAIDEMNDSFANVLATIKGIAGSILGELAGPISAIAQELLGVIRQAGPQQIAQNVAAGLLDFIKLAGNAFLQLAQFIEQFIKKYSPILGLELRTQEQQARDEEINRLRRETVIPAGVIDTQLRAEIQQEISGKLARLRELEQQVAAEAAGSILNQFQANFNAAIDTASRKLEEKMAPPGGEAGGLEIQERQLRELQQLNRNGQIGTVEILN
jgi:hypothetical protein